MAAGVETAETDEARKGNGLEDVAAELWRSRYWNCANWLPKFSDFLQTSVLKSDVAGKKLSANC